MPTRVEALNQLLISWRWPLLGLAFLVAFISLGPSGRMSFDRSIENMFSEDDELLEPYRKLQRVFGGNEVVLAVFVDPQLLDPDKVGIRRLAGIRRRLEQVPGVRAVLSLDRPIGDVIVTHSELAVRTRRLFQDYTHGADGSTVAAVCMLEPAGEATVARQYTIDRLREVVTSLPPGLSPGMLAGAPVMMADGFRHLERDGRRLSIWSTLLLSLTIVVCFRSLRWLLVPAAVVQLTLLATRAVLVSTGFRLSMVSSMLTAVVTVIGVATVVHVIVRFQEGRLRGLPPEAALLRAGRLLAIPILWACATDAVGFASLIVSRVGPVRDFGIMMSVGSLLVPLSVALVVPALALMGRDRSASNPVETEGRLVLQLGHLNRWVQARPARTGWLTLALLVFAVGGILRLEVETDFTKNFRRHSPVARSYQFVEERLGGAGVWDIILPAPHQLDWEYIERVQRLEARLRNEVGVGIAGVDNENRHPAAGLTKVLSLSDAVIATSPTDLSTTDVRLLREGVVRTGLAFMQSSMPVFTAALHGQDTQGTKSSYFRIMLRARERQPANQKRELIEQVTRISREEFPPVEGNSSAEVTGFFVLLASLISSLVRDQWLTFGVATLGIAAMLTVAFRSLRLAAAAVAPNALTILLVLGGMGWFGLRVNMGAAMIAAVSLGLSVDSSIHYVTYFRRLHLARGDAVAAIAEVQHTVGRAVVLSTLSLIVGFSVLCSSQFVPTVYFGLLVSLSMVSGLLGNLVLLPLLLRLLTARE